VRSGLLAGIPGHIQQLWFSFPLVICAAPGYFEKRPRPHMPEELEGHDLIGFRNRRTGQVQSWPMKMPAGAPAKQLPGDARFVFDDGDAAWVAMLAGAGIACVRRLAGSLRPEIGTLDRTAEGVARKMGPISVSFGASVT
jgi:DNA-binding transcriptional LysR family regulator